MRKALLLMPAIAASVLAGCVSTEQQRGRVATDTSAGGQATVSAAEICGDDTLDPQVRIDSCTVLIDTQNNPALLATAFADRGWAFYGLNQNRRSIADFDQAIALDPTNASAHFYRGMAHAALEDYAVAIADYDRTIALDPAHAGAFMRRAMARHDLGQYAVAIGDFDRAAALNPTYEEIYQFRGYSKCRLGRETQAYDDWMQADRIGDADRRRMYQRIAIDLGHYDGPVDGEATPQWHSAIAYWARVQC